MIHFISNGLKLEGLAEEKPGDKGAVITHPHPLYGGAMYNNVVEWITKVYGDHGYSTLRFNFRGVGQSGGNYDNGNGEQEDVLSAISYLRDKGLKSIDLAGYSFGSWINALVAGRAPVLERLILVSPPVGFINSDSIGKLPALALVVTGSEDDIAPAGIIGNRIPVWNEDAELKVIQGADHFYAGYGEALMAVLSAAVAGGRIPKQV